MEQGKRLNEFYGLLQQGTEQKKAFQQVFGPFPEVQKNFDEYVRKFTMPTWILKNPPQIDEKTFAVRSLTAAETGAELGGYYLWYRDLASARPHIEQALKTDPKLGLAHENMGFLDFAEGKDTEAAQELRRQEWARREALSVAFLPDNAGAFRALRCAR